MHGFFGSYNKIVDFDLSSFGSNYIGRDYQSSPLCVHQRTHQKFVDDKVWHDTDEFCYAIEGIVFGPTTNLAQLYKQYNETFPNVLRGSFSGFFYDKKKKLFLLFNDHIGDKMLFYFEDEHGVAFASDWSILYHSLGDRCSKKINERFCWSMLTYGYSPIFETPITTIHRLGAGEYLCISEQQCQRKRYHQFSNEEKTLSKQDCLSHIDKLFRQAVQRVLDKNAQYGYPNYLSLSAGLDSRMSVCVTRSLCTGLLHTITYSQSDYYDQYIPEKIAKQWHCEPHFTALDGGSYLQNINQSVALSQGLVNYSGPAQVIEGWRQVKNDIGVVLTGMLGDIIINSRFAANQPYHIGSGAISTRYLSQLCDIAYPYQNEEMYYLYVRGFSCANLGTPLVLQQQAETYSPFYDTDLLEFCLSIPKRWKYNYQLYDEWILSCYPQAAQWLHNGERKIGQHPHMVTLLGRSIALKELPKRICWFLCKHLHIHNFYRQEIGTSMNPEDSWLATNIQLKKTLDDYFASHLSILSSYPALLNASRDLYERGTAMEKFNVLTLLSALQLR